MSVTNVSIAGSKIYYIPGSRYNFSIAGGSKQENDPIERFSKTFKTIFKRYLCLS